MAVLILLRVSVEEATNCGARRLQPLTTDRRRDVVSLCDKLLLPPLHAALTTKVLHSCTTTLQHDSLHPITKPTTILHRSTYHSRQQLHFSNAESVVTTIDIGDSTTTSFVFACCASQRCLQQRQRYQQHNQQWRSSTIHVG